MQVATSCRQSNNAKGKWLSQPFSVPYLGTTGQLIPLMDSTFAELDLNPKACEEITCIKTIQYFDGEQKGTKARSLWGTGTG